jgi:hypothetical protein
VERRPGSETVRGVAFDRNLDFAFEPNGASDSSDEEFG